MSNYRKAIAAFITPFLGLPLADWIAGGAIDTNLLVNTVIAAGVALVTFLIPNSEPGL